MNDEKWLEWIDGEIGLFSPYDPDELKIIRAIKPKGRFNGEDASWRFPIEAGQALIDALDDSYWIDTEVWEEVAKWEQKCLEWEQYRQQEAQRKAQLLYQLIESADLHKPLPNGWMLFEHQKSAVEWLLAHRRDGLFQDGILGGILADHMGLGKTIAALVAAKALSQWHNACPTLVVCPASLRDNWMQEAEKVGITIETFSWARIPKPLGECRYILIADEAHYAQNLKSKRTQNLIELALHNNCLASWLLTGTPIKNGRPVNLFPLLMAIDHPLSVNKWEYDKRYCNGHYKSIVRSRPPKREELYQSVSPRYPIREEITIWENSGATHLDELSEKTRDCILRRIKKECLDLPQKQRIITVAGLEPKQQKAYDREISQLVRDYRERVGRGEVSQDAEALVTVGIMRKVGSCYKVARAILLAQELREQGQQVVIFTEFLESAQLLYGYFQEKEPTELLTGKIVAQKRQAIVDRFQTGESKVFIGTIKAGGVGLTLAAASNVILVDRPWTPGDAEQAEDRCHRIGQKQTVSTFWVQLGHIDRAIDELIHNKQKRIELVLKGKRKTLRGVKSPKEVARQLLEVL